MEPRDLSGNQLISNLNKYEASALLLKTHSTEHGRVVPQQKKQLIIFTPTITTQKPTAAEATQNYLSLQKMQQIIELFITKKQISIKELAEKLGVSYQKLIKLNAANYETLAAEINLPLIKLYCKTKWL